MKGKCSDDGRGLVKNFRDAWHGNLSEVHRWSMWVFQNKFSLCWTQQLSIDVILSKSAVTEATQHGGSSSCSVRSDGVGHHDAQTREKLFGRNDLRRRGSHR